MLWMLAALALADDAIDWGSAVTLDTSRSDRGVVVTLSVAPGFHVYGRRERWSVPLAVTADVPARRVRVPRGDRKALQTGAAWVLSGAIPLDVRLADASGPATGTLVYQVCTHDACAPPVEVAWIAR